MTYAMLFRNTLIGLGLMLASATTSAAIVCANNVNLSVPATGEGLYINFITGVSGTTEGQVPGFDFDPYASQNSTPAGQLRFYWGSASNNGAGVVISGDTYAVLGIGASIGPASTFSRAGFSGITDAWQAGTTGYLGARFKNEATTLVNYAWVRLSTTSPLGFPLTVVDWCYDDSGAAITITEPAGDAIFANGFEP